MLAPYPHTTHFGVTGTCRLGSSAGGDGLSGSQDSFLVRQDLLLAFLDSRLILQHAIEFCLVRENVRLIGEDLLLVSQQHSLVFKYFFHSHNIYLHSMMDEVQFTALI